MAGTGFLSESVPLTYGSHMEGYPGRIFLQKLGTFFQSLTVDFSDMVHCRDPIFFPVALKGHTLAEKAGASHPCFY